jgi:hypothetical protein
MTTREARPTNEKIHRQYRSEKEDEQGNAPEASPVVTPGFSSGIFQPGVMPKKVLALQRYAGNAATQRMLKGRHIQREVHAVPTSATGLIMQMDHANLVNNWCQIQADNIVQEPVWTRSGLEAQVSTLLSGPGYWEGHRTWAPRETVVDLGTFSDNVGISVTLELLQDNEHHMGSRGRVGMQGQSTGQTSFGNSTETSQTTSGSVRAGTENQPVGASAGVESSNTYGSEGNLQLGGQQQSSVNSSNSSGVAADLYIRATISIRRFNRFRSTQVGRASHVIHIGDIEYVNPTHRRRVAVPGRLTRHSP